jgi:Holliday junction DNA helicase RuvA subunit
VFAGEQRHQVAAACIEPAALFRRQQLEVAPGVFRFEPEALRLAHEQTEEMALTEFEVERTQTVTRFDAQHQAGAQAPAVAAQHGEKDLGAAGFALNPAHEVGHQGLDVRGCRSRAYSGRGRGWVLRCRGVRTGCPLISGAVVRRILARWFVAGHVQQLEAGCRVAAGCQDPGGLDCLPPQPKWANIQHRKGAQDARRGKVFTKIIREISVAARSGGGDPAHNPRLRTAIDKALSSNMSKDVVERAIRKATGELEGVSYEEIRYEGYAPGGVAVIVDCLTDNKVRTVADVRHAFGKFGGNLGTDGSVAFMFNKAGVLSYPPGSDEAAVTEAAIEAGADDVVVYPEDGSIEVLSAPEAFEAVRDAMRAAGQAPAAAEVTWRADNDVQVDGETARQVAKLLDWLEDLDDVQDVYSNADHLAVREDAHVLYGFAREGDRALFRALLKVSGVGGKMALGILSGMTPEEFSRAVQAGDLAALTRLPGVGRKTAERLVVEMRDKLERLGYGVEGLAAAAGPAAGAGADDDAVSALIALGYKPAEATRMVSGVQGEGLDTQALIRAALKAAAR